MNVTGTQALDLAKRMIRRLWRRHWRRSTGALVASAILLSLCQPPEARGGVEAEWRSPTCDTTFSVPVHRSDAASSLKRPTVLVKIVLVGRVLPPDRHRVEQRNRCRSNGLLPRTARRYQQNLRDDRGELPA